MITEKKPNLRDQLQDPIVSENALKVLKERYLAKDDKGITIEDPKGMYLRVATAIAAPEKDKEYWTEKFYNLMAENKFMPNSPTLMNAGRRLGMLSACFVLPVADDLDEIFSSVKATALVQRAGGGTGFNFSNLRPSGSIVKSSGGTTAGPLSFIDVFSQATNTIQQGAFRRGANMGIMDVRHPDIVNFIKAKSDLNRWQNYNISVAVTNDFMKELEVYPNNQHKVSHPEWGTGFLWVGHGEVRAFRSTEDPTVRSDAPWKPWSIQDTWNLICTRAWTTGEPGLFFIDIANEDNPVPNLGRIVATNPCITGDTKILTVNGPIAIKDLVEGNCTACQGTGNLGEDRRGLDIDCSKCNSTGRIDKKPIKLYAWDPDSKLPVIRTGFNPRKTACYTDIVEIEFDSGLKVRCTPNHNFRTFRGDKVEAQTLVLGQSVRAFSISKHRDGHLRAHGWVANRTAHQWVHRMVWEDANGEIPEGYVIHHKDGNPDNNDLSNLELLTSYDHQSEHYPDRLAAGFHNKKMGQAANHKVVGIRSAGKDDVYNITVEDVHTYIIVDPEYKGDGPDGIYSGIVSCNCGEQPLHAYDSCNLGSINLVKYAKTNDLGDFDWDTFGVDIATCVRFLDNVIEVNKYPIPEIKEMSHKTRRIGLGVMGWADLLFKVGVKYDSEQALKLAEGISFFLDDAATNASKELGKEKGNFGAWAGSRYEIRGTPMRNAYHTTVAPTGTISIIADCSGGIEPLFALAFKRTVMPDSSGKFKEMYEENRHWAAALLRLRSESDHFGLQEYARVYGSIKDYPHKISDDAKPLKDIFVTSHDIEPSWHVRMQAAWQKGIDTAISKTINIGHDAPIEVVSQAYLQAFALGCKGITVYRDGCRNNVAGMKQPMSVDKPTKPSPEPVKEPIATDVFPSFRTQIKTQFGNLHVHIVQDGNGKEREIFAQLGKAGDLIAADLEAICRMASLALKKGSTIEEVAEQLDGIGTTHIMPSGDGKIISMPDALAKAIRKYLKAIRNVQSNVEEAKPSSTKRKQDSIQSQYGVKCPQCSIGKLEFSEGCQKCRSCGYSAC